MEEKVLFKVDQNDIAYLTLNRPQKHNAFDKEMTEKCTTHLSNLHEMPSIRALVIKGNGKSFCAGADILWLERALHETPIERSENARLISRMLHFLDTLPIPTITYVHGAVMGGGIGIVACSDIVLCDSQSLFSFSETKIGLVPAIISPYVIRAMGARYTRRYFLTGEKFKALEAHHIGLVHEIVDLEIADIEIRKFIQYLLTSSPQAVRQAKSLIHQIVGDISEATRIMTIDLLSSLQISEEGKRRITAFQTKSSPPWRPGEPSDD
ncbi:MAG: enoyl-CoA hydratase/isomerase family protein [Alphaproteobacteria bacterium]|nr:enoyl-CoA hydratase/isomerase family protein [Alphaproteobacteria bacterium]